MLKTGEGNYTYDMEYARFLAERNYRIQNNDRLKIRVYTNEGERIIDPDFELQKELNTNSIRREESLYSVQKDGKVKIPMVGEITLEGLTLREAEKALEDEFSEFYKDPYVILEFDNKRVIVMGLETAQVIPLENEDMDLLEVITLAGGIQKNMKAHNIRLIRGDLKDPDVQIIDLSTLEGMKKADLEVYSGDIIYIEPVVRVFSESSRELIPLLSMVTSLVAIILALQN
ncbi:MAG: polysaccharide biosynthesis/export family protein [Cyclobacteriaceae bacterium]|nr:polysaccharide biosynthesis/export family protein [Cyclobacteriaceae bacterium]